MSQAPGVTMRLLWTLLFLECLLSTSHAQSEDPSFKTAGNSNGGLDNSSALDTGPLHHDQLLGYGGVFGTVLLSGSNPQAMANSGSSQEQNRSEDYQEEHIYLSDEDVRDFNKGDAQPPKASKPPALSSVPTLPISTPARTAALTPVPPVGTPVANQNSAGKRSPSEMSDPGSTDKSDMVIQGSSGQISQKAVDSSDHSDHQQLSQSGPSGGGGLSFSGSGSPLDAPTGSTIRPEVAAAGSYGQSEARLSGDLGPSGAGLVSGPTESSSSNDDGQSGTRLPNDYGKSEAMTSLDHSQPGHGIPDHSGPTGKAPSGGLDPMGAPLDGRDPQNRSPVDISVLPPPVHYGQGKGTKEGGGTPLNQLSSTISLDKVLLDQEELLGAIFLNSRNLIRERERLLKLLLGSRMFPGSENDLLEAAGSLALEGLLCRGPLGGLCGHGSLVGMNDVLKSIHSGKPKNWLNITNFDILQVSGRVSTSLDQQLQFRTKLIINFPGLLSFLGGCSVDVNIGVSFGLRQTEAGQTLLVLQNCQPIFTGIYVHTGLLSAVMESILQLSLKISLPNMLCPVVRFWFYIINKHLIFLKNILFKDLSPPLSSKLLPAEQYYYLDFKDKSFPDSFINWLIESAESQQPPYV